MTVFPTKNNVKTDKQSKYIAEGITDLDLYTKNKQKYNNNNKTPMYAAITSPILILSM